MTFTFKLARRLALAHLACSAMLGLLVSSCAPGQPLEGGLEPPPDQVLAVHTYPDSVTLHSDEYVDFTAVADLQDGNNGAVKVDWTATGGSITATGRFTASDTGTKKVIGKYRNGKSDTSTVVVVPSGTSAPTLVRIDVTPTSAALLPSGSQQFGATGLMSDGSTAAVSVNWTTDAGLIDATGFYLAPQATGSYLVMASLPDGSLADTALVTVAQTTPTLSAVILTPSTVSLQYGQTQQFSAQGRLTDGSVTSVAVTWTATGGIMSAGGLYTAGNTAGTYRVIAAAANGLADTSSVTVTAPTITSVVLTPASVSLQSGQTQQFSVSATLSNGSTQTNPAVTWSATGGNINSSGLYTAGLTAGTFRVIASSSNGKADTSSVAIALPTITSISLTPASVSLSTSQSQQFSVTATLSNGGSQTSPAVTWNANGGTITSAGLYTAGTTAGTFRVIATTSNGVADTSAITIATPTVTAITVTPATASLATGATQQFSAQATLSNGSTQTNPTVTWSATGGTISTSGLYTAGSTAGTFRVVATSGNGKADTSAVTLSSPTVTAIVVSPGSASVGTGTNQQFAASATLSTGGSQSNTPVTWSATGGTITSSGLYTAGSTQGTFRVIAVQQGGTLADTSAVTVTAPASGPYPNRPASFTNSSEVDFSQAVPLLPDNVDRPIIGAPSGWNMIYFGTNWTKVSDPTAPQSAPSVWNGNWPAGSYGGGVIGSGSGHGIGNVFTYSAMGTTRLYMSMRVYFDFDASQWHPISNKFVNIEGNNSLILMQLMEGGQWRHAEELSNNGNSWWVDNNVQTGETHLPGQLSNGAIPTRQWVQFEVLIDIPNHVFKIWQNGVLTTNATPTFSSTVMNTIGWNAFRGGGGETLSTDLNWKYDHFFIAW